MSHLRVFRSAVLWTLCLLWAAASAQATTRYISTLGNDSNTCATSQAPGAKAKRTFNGTGGAIQCMVGGDTLLVDDGAWPEQIGDTQGEAPGSKRPPSGISWDQPTVIRAINPRKATLNKPQPTTGHVIMLGLPDTQYLVIEGLVLDGRGHAACVWVGPASHIRLKNNVIKNCGGNGLYGAVADDGSGGVDNQLIDNEIFNIGIEDNHQPPGTHAVYFTGNNSVARGNYVHAPCPFYGLHFTSELGGLHSNIIENNRVVGCDQAGIFSQGSQTVIRNNLLENNCIGIYLSSAPTAVLNNTIYGTHTAPNCSDAYGIFDKSGGSTLVNNLILQQHTYVYSMKTQPTVSTNLCDAPGCQIQVAAYSSVVVDGPGGNLTLVPGGPAVNTGTPLAQVPTDLLGVVRPQGSGVDIGAYEYTTQAPPIDPPPVGPPPTGADTTAPTTTLTAPIAGTQVSGTTTLQAQASDNVAIAGLQFKLDGANLGPEITQPPYQYAWNTQATTPGAHTLSVSVRDPANNFGHSAPVGVTVVAAPVLPPATTGALICSGQIAAVPGAVSLRCMPEGSAR